MLDQHRDAVPAVVTVFGNSPVIAAARQELIRGVRGMLGRTLRVEAGLAGENAIVLGTLADLRPPFHVAASLPPDGYFLKTVRSGAQRYTLIAGSNYRGVLYGVFGLLRKMATGEPVAELDERQAPAVAVRWVNQWDNLDGTIERGYGGRSIFWDKLAAREDLSRVRDYGRVDSSSSTRRTIAGIALRPGDQIRIEGIPDGGETAALDYLEILPGH